MIPLMLHQSCDLGPVRAVTARIAPTPEGCEAEFRFEGRIGGIVVPGPGPSLRSDGLWRTTCCEIFWQELGETAYHELNLAPSGRWAAYAFDDYREGMREAAVGAIAIAAAQIHSELVIKASIAADLPSPAQVGLSVVIEHADGALQYWALAFPPGRPDFHSEACRTLVLER